MSENLAALELIKFLGSDWFKFLVFPLIAALIGIVIKYCARKDAMPRKNSDFAIGQELILGTVITYLGLIAAQSADVLEAQSALVLQQAVAAEAQAEEVQTVVIEGGPALGESAALALDVVLQMAMAFGLLVTLIVVAVVTRLFGWETNASGDYDLKLSFTIGNTVLGVILLVWVVSLV